MMENAEQFANALRDFSPTINQDDAVVIYNDLAEGYDVLSVQLVDESWYEYGLAMSYVKREHRHKFKVVHIALGYKSEWCSQDMPSETALIDTTNGGVITLKQLWKHFHSQA